MSFQPRISIITVVYNGEDTLEKTIKSIIGQDYKNIEYIIIDGKSTDHTIEIIKKYDASISKWISEPDKGIYDAMNKGIELATGDFLWFINSGDEIAADNTLSFLFGSFDIADIYYGETIIIDNEGKEVGDRRLKAPEKLTWKSFKNGMLVSHQSFIVSKKNAGFYNTKYRFSADFEWCLLALKKADKIINTHQVLSRFLDGGMTKQNIIPGLVERFKIMCNHYGITSTIYQHAFIAIKFFTFYFKHNRF